MDDTKKILEELSKIGTILEELDKINTKLENLDHRVTNLDHRVTNLDHKVTNLDHKVTNLDHKVTNLQLILENETSHNIEIIAEGHLDLSRRLHDVLRVENEQEMLMLRISKNERDIRKIKEALEIA